MSDIERQDLITPVAPEPIGSGMGSKAPMETETRTEAESADAPDYSDSSDINAMGAQAYEPEESNHENFAARAETFDDLEDFRINEDRFTALKPVWNDTKFAIFFLIMLAYFIFRVSYLLILYLPAYLNEHPVTSPVSGSVFQKLFLFNFILVLASGSSLYIFLKAAANAAGFINFGVKFSIGFLYLAALSSLGVGQFLQGLMWAAFATALFYINKKYKPSITLAGKVLEIVVKVLKKYRSVVAPAFIGLFSNVVFTLLLTAAVGCEYLSHGFHSTGQPINDPETGETISKLTWGLIFNLIFLNFAGLYIIDVLKNVIHITIGGIYGTWYYLESTFEGMPQNESNNSFKRALTYSLGSVCFGSLFVVIFQVFGLFVMIGDSRLGVFGTINDAFLKFLSFAVGYFNLYAFAFVALYGNSLTYSAMSAWKFLKQRGFHALTNDVIIGTSLGFYCVIAAIVGMVATGIYLFVISLIFSIDDSLVMPLTGFSFVMSIYVSSALIQTVISGSSVFFTALNKDPSVFQESNPFEFQEISRCYPKVLDKLQL